MDAYDSAKEIIIKFQWVKILQASTLANINKCSKNNERQRKQNKIRTKKLEKIK